MPAYSKDRQRWDILYAWVAAFILQSEQGTLYMLKAHLYSQSGECIPIGGSPSFLEEHLGTLKDLSTFFGTLVSLEETIFWTALNQFTCTLYGYIMDTYLLHIIALY